MYLKLQLCRQFDLKVEELVAANKLMGDYHLSIGQEGVAVGVMSALSPSDAIVSNFRGHAHAIARGVPTNLLMAELFGKSDGTCKGIGGSMHCPKYPELNLLFATAVVGSGIPIGAGMALANKVQGSDGAVVVFFGDGAVNTGAFHEGLNMAAIWKLPLVLVCENNQFAMSMATKSATSGESIAGKAAGYGVTGLEVDGNDPFATYQATKLLVGMARTGRGPGLLECRTRRLRAHSTRGEKLPATRRASQVFDQDDPLSRFEGAVLREGLADDGELGNIRAEATATIAQSVDFAERGTPMSPEDLSHFV